MKILKVLAVSCAITIMSSFSAFADWEQVGTQWKYKDEVTGAYVASQWIESATEKGLWYYIDENGIMATNTVIDNQYYVNEAGEWRENTGGSSSVNSGNQSVPDDNSRGGLGAPIELGEEPVYTDPEWGQQFNEGIIR